MIFCYSSLSGPRQTNSFKIRKDHVQEGLRTRSQTVRVLFPDSETFPPLFQINRADRIEDWPLKTPHELLLLFPHL